MVVKVSLSKINDIWRGTTRIMHTAFLLIGGNLGNRQANLAAACSAIVQHCGTITTASALYETAAWGVEAQPSFLNQALALQTFSKPHALLQQLLHIEISLGRIREKKYGPRLIDIDILLYDDQVIQTPELIVPHPELQNRRFALTCLADIAPDFIHPVFQKPIAVLLAECTDPLAVHKFS
ncbi:MAG TPA: 2-amino-4-hydroxy-6-hydroxymethyldihydropteridine diphosphokinase [Chitinophagaceae bacterium]|nr:2-amino-4-hydroxy-6-hydroxymethyldihydropteridine diphosphokinase [Chitinophagaceae bacterium]